MITIIFEAHGTTFDNENHIASGHFDVDLSSTGIHQSRDLGERYKDVKFGAIFCSDLQRSYKTGQIAFIDRYPILKDSRLRECDYGDYTQRGKEDVDKQKLQRIVEPFPHGQSYIETTEGVKNFLKELLRQYDGQTIMIIGHRATQYALENIIKGTSLEQIVVAPWKWQPGWKYELNTLV